MSRLHTLYVCLGIALTANLAAQNDPGPRRGAPGAGGYFPTLDATEQQFFSQALTRFQEVDSVSGTLESGLGLGPTSTATVARCATRSPPLVEAVLG